MVAPQPVLQILQRRSGGEMKFRIFVSAIAAALLSTSGCNGTGGPRDAAFEAANFAEGGGRENPRQADDQFKYRFETADQARQAFGAHSFDALAAAGVRYDPIRRQFLRQTRVFAPEFVLDRGGAVDVIVRIAELDEQGAVLQCEACSVVVGLVRARPGAGGEAARIIDIGMMGSNGMGSMGTLHLVAQGGHNAVFQIDVGWATQGQVGGSSDAFVVGERGFLPPLVPLSFSSAEAVEAAEAGTDLPAAQVRLDGDRLRVSYASPAANIAPGRAAYRIGPDRLELIEGTIPAELNRQ